MSAENSKWSLKELIDFEVAVQRSPGVKMEVGRKIRRGLSGVGLSDFSQRRWAFKEWLKEGEHLSGARVIAATRFGAIVLFSLCFLLGVGMLRGLITELEGARALNIWVMLAGTLGVQWLILIGGLVTFLLARYWIGGVGWLKEVLAVVVRRLAGKICPKTWQSLVQGKGRQPSALAWRLTRMLQLGGVGFNLGLLFGLFGALWFTEVRFYWESSLSQFGGESLGQLTRFLAGAWGGEGLSEGNIRGLKDAAGEVGDANWNAFSHFIFLALLLWGLLPRLLLWWLAVWKERGVLSRLEFQDLEHRKLWRELSRVERVVSMEGMRDGVVLLDVGGVEFKEEDLRPFLLQKLRVNPERFFSVGVLDAEEEREAWQAMRTAPCGVVMVVEGWDLSPKQMKVLLERIRREAGEETILRVLVLGDGLAAPAEVDFASWQNFVDELRDPRLECVAYAK